MRGLCSSVALLATVAGSAALAAPQRLVLAPRQALKMAENLERSGDKEGAESIYRQVRKDRDPIIRGEASFRLAHLLADRNRPQEAAIELRRLIDDQPKAGAVRIGLAQLLDRMGDIDGARRQLRAAQAGGLPPQLAQMAERYANALRARAPFGWSVEMAVAPDSNINRATRSDTLSTVIGSFDLTPGSKARSGIGMALSGSAFTRVGVTDSLAWVSRVQGNGDRYREPAFNRLNLSASTGLEWSSGPTRVALDAGVGRSTFGGKAFQRTRQLSLRAYRPLGPRTAVSGSLSTAKVDNRINDLQDGRSLGASLAVDRALSPRAGVQLSLSAGRFKARDPGYSTRGREVAVGGWLDLGRWTLSASAAHGTLDADERLVLFPTKREDRYNRATIGVTARQLQLFGFSPLARFTVERNHSNVEIWDYSRRRFELGVARAF